MYSFLVDDQVSALVPRASAREHLDAQLAKPLVKTPETEAQALERRRREVEAIADAETVAMEDTGIWGSM